MKIATYSDYYKWERDKIDNSVAVNDLSGSQELELWNKLLKKFRYETAALMDIKERAANATKRMWEEEVEDHKFALEMKYIDEEEYYAWLSQYRDENFRQWSDEYNAATLELKAYSDSAYDDAVESLDKFENEFYEWFNHCVKMGEMTAEAQRDVLLGFVEEYNAKVSEIVASTELGAEETARLWKMAYTVRREGEEGAYEAQANVDLEISDQMEKVYLQWEKDKDAWIELHNAYNDWDEIGDSLISVYQRCIDKQKEFFDSGVIEWEKYKDETRRYSLLLSSAISDEYDKLLKKHSDSIKALETKFDEEIQLLKNNWDVEDRKQNLSDVRRQISIYKNAATDTGREYYEELLEKEKQLEREEKLYQLELNQSKTLEELWDDYGEFEAAKSKVLSGIKNADLTTAAHSGDISFSVDALEDIASGISENYSQVGYSSLDMLYDIYDVLGDIKKRLGGSSSTYTDNRKVTINTADKQAIATVINGTIVSTLGSVRFVG